MAAIGGWKRNEQIHLDYNQKKIIFRNHNCVEGRYQKEIGVCYGSGLMAGKFAGWGERIFAVPCWSKQTKFIANGDDYNEFSVFPSDKTIETELNNLLAIDKATKADMAVAIKRLNNEIIFRKEAEKELHDERKQRVNELKNYSEQLEQTVRQQTS